MITDRNKTINQHLNSINLTPIDIPEKLFEVDGNFAFDLQNLILRVTKKKKTNAVLKMLRKIADISNSCIVKNFDGLLSKKTTEMEVEWIGKLKKDFRLINTRSLINRFTDIDPYMLPVVVWLLIITNLSVIDLFNPIFSLQWSFFNDKHSALGDYENFGVLFHEYVHQPFTCISSIFKCLHVLHLITRIKKFYQYF